MDARTHWQQVYTGKAATQLSWFQDHAALSLRLIASTGLAPSASIIDVGGGASTLLDDLLAAGFRKLSVLDLSAAALAVAAQRIGSRAAEVRWIEADVLDAALPESGYELWHDRAVFHFLGSDSERRIYIKQLRRALKPDGWLLLATFAEDGPMRCSGLPVTRYRIDELDALFADSFRLVEHAHESHRTPGGAEQKFVYGLWRRRDG